MKVLKGPQYKMMTMKSLWKYKIKKKVLYFFISKFKEAFYIEISLCDTIIHLIIFLKLSIFPWEVMHLTTSA